MLSQWHIAGEKFTVNASASDYVSVYLGAISKNVQPLILRVPGVHFFQIQVPECFCPYFFLYYVCFVAGVDNTQLFRRRLRFAVVTMVGTCFLSRILSLFLLLSV
jgi:hypothetical protein